MFLLPMVDSKGKKPFVKMVFVVLLGFLTSCKYNNVLRHSWYVCWHLAFFAAHIFPFDFGILRTPPFKTNHH